MNVELKEVESLKIVPENYESGALCCIKEIGQDKIKLNLNLLSNNELCDYAKGKNVEIFGLNRQGVVYFTSCILENLGQDILIEYPKNIKEIQRRKYSRVPYDGKLIVIGKDDIKIKTEDISAGGLKFTSDTPFMVGSEYDIRVELANGLTINCAMQPIRVEEVEENENALMYSISTKFKKIRSIDRIALMQYSLRIISEMENKA